MEFNKVVAGSFYYVNQYRAVLAKALFLPFVACLIIDGLSLEELNTPLSLLVTVAGLVIQVIMAITVHRIMLLGPAGVSEWGITSWSQRETNYLLSLIGLSLMMLPFGLIAIVPLVGGLIAVALICWLSSRLFLVFPDIAVGETASFRRSWELTEKYQLLMFLVVILFPVLLGLPVYLVSLLPYSYLLSSLFSTLAIVVGVAALSMSYQLITQEARRSG